MYDTTDCGPNLNNYIFQSPLIFNFRFKWYNTLKPLGSGFFGTSPEFEMSLYSLIYMMGYSHAKIDVGGVKVRG